MKEKTSCSFQDLQKSGSGAIISDKTKVTPAAVTFPMKTFNVEVTTLYDVVNKCEIYDRVTVEVKVYSLVETDHVLHGTIKEGHAIDNSNTSRNISFFGESAQNSRKYKTPNVTKLKMH